MPGRLSGEVNADETLTPAQKKFKERAIKAKMNKMAQNYNRSTANSNKNITLRVSRGNPLAFYFDHNWICPYDTFNMKKAGVPAAPLQPYLPISFGSRKRKALIE